jgi:hypothetical protein
LKPYPSAYIKRGKDSAIVRFTITPPLIPIYLVARSNNLYNRAYEYKKK